MPFSDQEHRFDMFKGLAHINKTFDFLLPRIRVEVKYSGATILSSHNQLPQQKDAAIYRTKCPIYLWVSSFQHSLAFTEVENF